VEGAGKLPENKNKKTLFWRGWRDGGKQKERVALHMIYPPEHNFAYYSALLFSRYFTDSIPTYSVERRGEEREKLLVTSQQRVRTWIPLLFSHAAWSTRLRTV